MTAAAAEEEIVIHLVVGGRPCAVKKSGRGSLERDNNSTVRIIRIYVATESIVLPTKTSRVVKFAIDILPVLGSGYFNIVVRRHLRQGQNSIFICNIRPCHSVHGPV